MALGCLFIFSVFVWGVFVVSLFLLILIKFFFEVNFHHYVVNLYLFLLPCIILKSICVSLFSSCVSVDFWGFRVSLSVGVTVLPIFISQWIFCFVLII